MTAPRARFAVEKLPLYVPGLHKTTGDVNPAVLSANENALGPSPAARKAFRAAAARLHRYPDGHASELRQALAAHHGLEAERIVCGAGSDELITQLARLFAGPGDEVLYYRHSFVMYPVCAQQVGATPVGAPGTAAMGVDVDALLAHVTDRTRIVFIANPNNPTGSCLPAREVRRLADGLRDDILLVIDAAYAEYAMADDYSAGAELVRERANVVMLRTFSKIHALAALRVGWGYFPPAIASAVNRMRDPFNVNSAGQAAAAAALGDLAHVRRSRRHNALWRKRMQESLENGGFTVTPSEANFLLAACGNTQRAERLYAFLMQQGVIARAVASAGLPDHIRVTVGTAMENRRFMDALKSFRD